MTLFFVLIVFVGSFLMATAAVVLGALVLERRSGSGAVALDSGESGLFKVQQLSSISPWHDLLARADFTKTLKERIAQADLNWSVGRVTAAMLLAGTVTLAILGAVSWVPGWAALGAAVLAGLVPYFHIMRRRARRFNLIEDQMPDALEFLARALRAGHPLAVSMDLLATEHDPPLSAEIRTTSDERKLGVSWDDALRHLTERVPLLDIRLFSAAVALQNRTGGKLNEVLIRLAETMRESSALRGEVRALSAHGRLTGTILTCLPIGIALMMAWVAPGYFSVLIEHPYGKHVIAAAIICLVLAHVIIGKIVDVKL